MDRLRVLARRVWLALAREFWDVAVECARVERLNWTRDARIVGAAPGRAERLEGLLLRTYIAQTRALRRQNVKRFNFLNARATRLRGLLVAELKPMRDAMLKACGETACNCPSCQLERMLAGGGVQIGGVQVVQMKVSAPAGPGAEPMKAEAELNELVERLRGKAANN